MEPEDSLSYTQAPDTRQCPEPDKCSLYLPNQILKDLFQNYPPTTIHHT